MVAAEVWRTARVWKHTFIMEISEGKRRACDRPYAPTHHAPTSSSISSGPTQSPTPEHPWASARGPRTVSLTQH